MGTGNIEGGGLQEKHTLILPVAIVIFGKTVEIPVEITFLAIVEGGYQVLDINGTYEGNKVDFRFLLYTNNFVKLIHKNQSLWDKPSKEYLKNAKISSLSGSRS